MGIERTARAFAWRDSAVYLMDTCARACEPNLATLCMAIIYRGFSVSLDARAFLYDMFRTCVVCCFYWLVIY